MLRTATSNLPPEQQWRLHPDFLANEADYLRMRDSLLGQHRDGGWPSMAGESSPRAKVFRPLQKRQRQKSYFASDGPAQKVVIDP